MHTAIRPLATASVALLGASVIAVTPVAPPPQALVSQIHVPAVHMPAVQLSASIIDIFTFPAFRQYVLNQIDDLATLGIGLAGSAAGLGQSIAALPPTLVTATQQVLTGDLLGALTTVQTYVVGSIVAIGEPTLNAIIERRQRFLAVSEALQVAVPQAIVDVIGGFGGAADTVIRAFIVAGQNLVDAVLSLNLGNIASALVDGTTLVVGSFVEGGQQVVDGIVSAQQTLATALAAQPAATAVSTLNAKASAAKVTDVPDLSRKTATVAVSRDDTTETATVPSKKTSEEATSSEKETPKSEDTNADSAAEDDSSTTPDKPSQPAPKSRKHDTEKKRADSPKHETAKADNDSESGGAEKK